MLTSSHAYLTWRLVRGRPRTAPRVLGSVLPDLPGWTLGPVLRARGYRGERFLRRLYHEQPLQSVHEAAHSAPLAALVLVLAPRGSVARALAQGWLGHLAVDAVTHGSDAWPLLVPLTRRTWASPVSYWEPGRHPGAFRAAELALVAATARAARVPAALTALASLLASRSWPPR